MITFFLNCEYPTPLFCSMLLKLNNLSILSHVQYWWAFLGWFFIVYSRMSLVRFKTQLYPSFFLCKRNGILFFNYIFCTHILMIMFHPWWATTQLALYSKLNEISLVEDHKGWKIIIHMYVKKVLLQNMIPFHLEFVLNIYCWVLVLIAVI